MSWTTRKNNLIKTFSFQNFIEAVDFINTITPICETAKHHPDFTVFDYKFIKFSLTTHDIGKISEKDYELAKQLDQIYTKYLAR